MVSRILKTCVSMAMVSFLFVGMAWAAKWEVVEFSDENSYVGGSVEFLPNGFVITSTGGDIWSGKLGCTLVYLADAWTGDFTIEYTIEEHTAEPPLTWSKGGVMIAQEIDPETAYVFIQSTPSNHEEALNDKGTKIITRAERAGDASPGSNGLAPLQWPVTYKMVRTGDLFTVSVSFDGGSTYQSVAVPAEDKLDNTTVAFEGPVFIGFALNGNISNEIVSTATARIVDIKINGGLITAAEPAGKMASTWAALKAY